MVLTGRDSKFGYYDVVVRHDTRMIMFTHNIGEVFSNILFRRVEQDVNLAIKASVSNKVVVSTMGYISLGQRVVTEKLLEEGNSTVFLGVNITISPDKNDWVRVFFI